jgi:hypothetical protein
MEEDEYRLTYSAVNQRRCVFEKTLNARQCDCSRMNRFLLADREGAGCRSPAACHRCGRLLELMRNSARFLLQMTRIGGPLPHNEEMRVQTGGLLGLQAVVNAKLADATNVPDIYGLVDDAENVFGRIDDFPFDRIVKRIVSYDRRSRRSRRPPP